MKPFTLFYFIVFVCALLVGYTISTQFTLQGPDSPSVSEHLITISNDKTMKSMANGQRSILLIGVSDLNVPHPRLESAWLVSYFPFDSAVHLLPIVPSGKQVISDFENLLSQSFIINQTNGAFSLGQEFITILEKNNYWWSGYLIFDEHAMVKTVEAIGGIAYQGKILAGEQVLAEYHRALGQPLEAYKFNLSILQSTCRIFSTLSAHQELSELAMLYPNHLLTDLDLSLLQSDWQSLFTSDQLLGCSFPLSNISRQIP